MAGVNKVIILGRLGQDPELKHTPSGQPVCKFSVATSESFVGKDGQKQETTEWHNIVVWGKPAENCSKFLARGRQVYLEGKLATRSWDDKQSGQKRFATEIVAQSVQFISDGQRQQQPQGQPQYNQNFAPPAPSNHVAPSMPQDYDNIPF